MTKRLLVLAVACLSVGAVAAAPLQLAGVSSFPAVCVPQGQSVDVPLPPLPAKPGLATVLAFRVVTVAGGPGGCNWNMALLVNGRAPGRLTSAGAERLLGRPPSLELTREHLCFPVFSGDKLMVMYAADAGQGDTITTDGLGATFTLDVTDVVRGVDGNTLTLRNVFPGQRPPGQGQLQVTDLRVGYLDRSQVPVAPSQAPHRGPISGGVTAGKLRLAQSCSGGFSLRQEGGPELLVETGLSMKASDPSALVAEDNTERSPELSLKCSAPLGNAYQMKATWPGLTLQRTLRLQDGRVAWHEKWTNTGDKRRGVPFRHRFFLRDKSAQFWIGGSTDNCSLASSPGNPTLFAQAAGEGNGFGVTAESDWLRLLGSWRAMSDLGELASNCLSLGAGQSIEFDLTITPVSDGGGYWSFINGLRQRWDLNKVTMPAPLFWGFTCPTGPDAADQLRKTLAPLGPVIVTVAPWERLEPDARVVRAGRYPKLPPNAPRTTGKCPDLDVNAFLTFAHREPYWQKTKADTELIHRVCPQAKVIAMIHPAMETVYRPLRDKWPIAPDAIRTETGEVFQEAVYDRAWLGDMMNQDWGVLYYCPHEGGPQLRAIVDGICRAMDECGVDGVYSDEFSFAFTSRGYSRYDYGRSDGYSADLDESGAVTREKADNGWLSQAAQLQILAQVAKRGKFFLGNGGNALRSTSGLLQRFIEGGNGPAAWGQGHLDAVPLVLGNMGDQKTRQGVFDSVKVCLRSGSVYSPTAVNMLLSGNDNFVCKQYPLTIQQLGPGFVIGRERILTTVSRSFHWPGASGTVALYRYGADGSLLGQPVAQSLAAGKPLAVTVPQDGLVIVEKR